MNLTKYLEISKEVQQALENNQPVIALESTIIAHGMPYPQNLETALKAEQIARENKTVPATIAILNGKIKVGLTKQEIDYLAKKANAVAKVSRKDLPVILVCKADGATTVASTMIIAALAGIKIFATGGIGGVHRNAQTTMDISADLEELAMTNVAVVCAGAKSILDLGLTLEYLETKGVVVLGYQTNELPAFYTQKSGFQVDYQIDTPKQIAKILKTKWDLNLKGSVVIANPIPKDFAMDFDIINNAIDKAIVTASEKGIKRKNTTPFLLAKVKEITKGKSLDANIQLVFNNVKLACEIAKHYYLLK